MQTPTLFRFRPDTYRNYEYVERLGKSVRECYISGLWVDEVCVGKLYEGRNLSFIETVNYAVNLICDHSFFKKPDHHIIDQDSSENLGHIEIPGGVARTGFIYLRNTAYSIRWERDEVRLFRPSTWKKPDRYDMLNSEVMIHYYMKPDGSVSVESNKDDYYLEILLGVFLIREIVKRRNSD